MSASPTLPPRPHYSMVRVEKIKSLAELERRSQHNDRTNVSENVDPTGPPPRSLLPDVKGTLSDRTTDLLDELGINIGDCGGKVIACEMVLTASKAFFATCTEREFDAWVQSSVDFAKATLGRGLIDIQLHMDEETPHIHPIGVPVVKRPKLQRGAPPRDPAAKAKWEEDKRKAPLVWTLSYDALFGGSRDRLSKLQDEYHGAVAHLGLSRGERSRSDKTIELGDGIQIDAADFSRGQNVDGTERSRRNISPKEYREIIKQKNDVAALDAEESRRAREASERLLGQAAFGAEMAAKDMRAAEKALQEALAEKTKAEAEARAQQDMAKLLRAQADHLLNEAKAEKAAAIEEAAAVKAELKQERDYLEEQRRQDQLRLGLLEKAVDDRNGLNLRPEGETFVMELQGMTPSEQSAYRTSWPRALFEIARKLAEVMAKIRSLWKFVSDKENLALVREAAANRREEIMAQKTDNLAARERNFAEREALVRSRDQEVDLQVTELQHRDVSLERRELAISSVEVELQRRERDLLLRSQTHAAMDAASEGWAGILQSVMHGDYYMAFDRSGRPSGLVPNEQDAAIPPDAEACFASTPPAWAFSFLLTYQELGRQAETVGTIEGKAIAHEKRLKDLVESAGPVLNSKQEIEVSRIKDALASKPTAAEIAAHLHNGGLLR